MTQYVALAVLRAAGFTVTPEGTEWHVTAPPGSRGAALQPEGAVLPEWVMIALAKAVEYGMTPQARMVAASRWN